MVSLTTGKRLWDFETEDVVSASPAVANGRVVIGSEDGKVYCFGQKKK
jgi:outer membrane protein assembly factor BamB